MDKIYGIDLGTTYSCISYVDEFGKPVVVANAENERTTPSVVFFDEDKIIVGSVAKESAKLYPDRVVSFIKRNMGNGEFVFKYDEENEYKPEELSAFVLRKLVGDAEEALGEEIHDVVITCPAYFGINEREATKIAGEIAGLNVRQILNEPTSAALAYGLENGEDKVVLVYDLGGGTFDISMIDIKQDSIRVICTGGDHNLGGKDFDDRIICYLQEQFVEQTGINEDILSDLETAQELQNSAERAKKILSTREMVPISVNYNGEKAKISLTREVFQDLTYDLLERTMSLTHEMLEEAKEKGYYSFDEIVLVGGSSRMPVVREAIYREFNIEPRLFDPDEAVAKGAALYGNKLSINDELIRRIAEDSGESFEEVRSNLEENNIDDDILERVLQDIADDTGFKLAAVKGANIEISNVVSKSFGVVAIDSKGNEIVSNLIFKNSTVPCEVTKGYGTNEEGQESALIRIMESEVSESVIELELAQEIGVAELSLPPGLPYNSPILITFTLNEDGRLEMRARETRDNKNVEIAIETTCVISGDELVEAKERSKNIIVS
ncbi:Hsp70 family protein [Clostridium cellulovorans]|uniref:Chaperone protein DnaK n=1 Tax=Clostridium cellulovorans (strain ATCC 35296 / DSM 3052 / OCM 3 / 743B) TaxID=573061 RepID=D9SVA8_CLOC7|nr:Hsp70 family protein [Clostridium cellulovorans]ADL51032.1 Heat shock protein 70 [Clostridium cellulovorans 743B]